MDAYLLASIIGGFLIGIIIGGLWVLVLSKKNKRTQELMRYEHDFSAGVLAHPLNRKWEFRMDTLAAVKAITNVLKVSADHPNGCNPLTLFVISQLPNKPGWKVGLDEDMLYATKSFSVTLYFPLLNRELEAPVQIISS